MPYTTGSYAQDAMTGRVGLVLDTIAKAAQSVPYDIVDAAVAYATRRGVQLLTSRIASTEWDNAKKRFLISIDFGITEPAALTALNALPNTEVRVPNGISTLSNKYLIPQTTFHTKAYMFRVANGQSELAIVIGSANISVSALATGAEAVGFQSWHDGLTTYDIGLLAQATPLLDWFEEAWDLSDPVSAVLPGYSARFTGGRRPQSSRDDQTPAAQAYTAPAGAVEVSGSLAVQLGAARSLWVKSGTLYHNRGQGKPGNQLDTPRGTRVFFGFPATEVSRNTVLGDIETVVSGFTPVARSVRFGNNMMDKVNLPIPGDQGPGTYDNAYLIFDRAGTGSGGRRLFSLTIADLTELNARKAAAKNVVNLYMAGGRPYGLLF